MNIKDFTLFAFFILFAGCASVSPKPVKLVVWETKEIARPHDVLGPVSINEQITESNEDMIQGIAGFISKDGRISDQIPSEMKTALELKRQKYKEMIFDKLGAKAREYGADAVMGAEYTYIPPYVSFSPKATVTAQGTMIKYKNQ